MEKHESPGAARGPAHREVARRLLALQGGAAEVVEFVALGRGGQAAHNFFADRFGHRGPRVCNMSAPRMTFECPRVDSGSHGKSTKTPDKAGGNRCRHRKATLHQWVRWNGSV